MQKSLVESDLAALVDLERQVNEAIGKYYEDEYYVAVAIINLHASEKWKAVADSWSAYCALGRIGVQKSHAYRLEAYGRIRAKLADLSPIGDNQWSEWNVRPLTKLDPRDAKRLSGKIRTHLKNNPDEKLTSTLVERFIKLDQGEDLGDGDGFAAVDSVLDEFNQYLKDELKELRAFVRQLKETPSSAWETVEVGVAKRLAKALNDALGFIPEEE